MLALDGLWFLAAERATGFDQALAMDLEVWARYASLLVKRIRNHFGMEGSGLAALAQIILHDPMWWSMDLSLSEQPGRLILEVRNCPALMAQERMNRETFTCEAVERAYLGALGRAVDPAITLEALKLPPRAPDDPVCCQWAFLAQIWGQVSESNV